MTSESLLVLNAGSSSLKFALFAPGPPLARIVWGKFDRIGLPNPSLSVASASGKPHESPIGAADHASCMPSLVQILRENNREIAAIGHRIVHGGPDHFEPTEADDKVLDDLHRISPFDPDHMPAALALIELCRQQFPGARQIACFDTAFHHNLPRIARLLPIPRKYEARGVRRYGFHGLSYEYLMGELETVAGKEAAMGCVVLAHLGNGASLAAVHQGKCLDTTMAFTPTAGIPMSTRSGDLDPGLVAYFAHTEGMTTDQFHHMVNAQSGLLGLSETSSDVRDLLAAERTDARAAEALGVFCYQARKAIGAMATALGGIDTLVFAGGIGENAPDIRARICDGLQFLGLELDKEWNAANAPVISQPMSRATIRVIATDEELHIARLVTRSVTQKTRDPTLIPT